MEAVMAKKIVKTKKRPIGKIIGIIVLAIIVLFIVFGLFNEMVTVSTIPSRVYLDFQNKTGVARIQSNFTDLLISSEGSYKKGDGYVVKLKIINPSSITLQIVNCKFSYSGSQVPVIYDDINFTIPPGRSKTVKCFISNLSDYDLKSIGVAIHFDQLSFY